MFFKNRLFVFMLAFFLATTFVSFAAFTKIFWDQIESSTLPTTLAGYGITDAVSAASFSEHIASTSVHGTIGDVIGASGSQTLYYKTLGDTNIIDGGAIKTGFVASSVIDNEIARDNEIPTNASFSFIGLNDSPATFTGQALKLLRVNATEDAVEFFTPTAGVTFKRAEVLISPATSTVTFTNDIENNPVAIGTFQKCIILLNGVAQKYSNFTKTSSTVIESTQGDIASGTLVTLIQID